MSNWDAIVIGLGGAGSGALHALAERGVRVLGLDRFPIGHDRGSSHGATRIIRTAYFEEPRYVPLVRRAFSRWSELEAQTGTQLYQPTGILQLGPEAGPVLRGIRASAAEHGLAIEILDGETLRRRFPAFAAEGLGGIFEHEAGYLRVEACVKAQVARATQLGAKLELGAAVLSFAAEGAGVRVVTERAVHTADRLIVTPGVWAKDLLAGLPLEVQAVKKSVFWFESPDPRYLAENGFPVFLVESDDGIFYGFPNVDGAGVKVAEHSGGAAVPDPLRVDRTVDSIAFERTLGFVRRFLPGVQPRLNASSVCFYELSPDEHFYLDRDPRAPQICFAAGLSGHGFKFSPVLGEILADLALLGRTEAEIDFLSLDPNKRPRPVPRAG